MLPSFLVDRGPIDVLLKLRRAWEAMSRWEQCQVYKGVLRGVLGHILYA